MTPKLTKTVSSLVGILFLFSGMGKALAVYQFAQILSQYGFDFLQYLAPVVIVVEIVLGLLLFFCIRLRITALLSLCFTAVLTLIYFYGHIFVNISDCGCFGYFSFMNMPPLFTYLRNLILIGLLLFIFLKSKGLHKTLEKSELLTSCCILCAVCFTIGFTYYEHKSDVTQYYTEGELINMNVKDTKLGEFYTFSSDSTYLVFAFSYSCPHCYNSIENLKQYESMNVVDKVVGISYFANPAGIQKFDSIFHPNFEIRTFHPVQLFDLTNTFPHSYYIKNNRIKMKIDGVLPCGYLLQHEFNKMEE